MFCSSLVEKNKLVEMKFARLGHFQKRTTFKRVVFLLAKSFISSKRLVNICLFALHSSQFVDTDNRQAQVKRKKAVPGCSKVLQKNFF